MFNITSIAYGHQNFEKILLTLINLETGKLYTYDDILDFAKSCALTDSTKQLVTTANWQITCVDSASADNVLLSIANNIGYVHIRCFAMHCTAMRKKTGRRWIIL